MNIEKMVTESELNCKGKEEGIQLKDRDDSTTEIDNEVGKHLDEADEIILQAENDIKVTSSAGLSIFLTETDSDFGVKSKLHDKRQRNRTIDYHTLPSLYWEASVQNYHEKKSHL